MEKFNRKMTTIAISSVVYVIFSAYLIKLTYS